MLRQLAGQKQADSSLNFARSDGRALVVVRQARGLGCDALEYVVDEGVHDAHGLGRNAGVRVHLLQHLVDVDSVGFLPLLPALLVTLGDVLLGLARLFGSLSTRLGRHGERPIVPYDLWPKFRQRLVFRIQLWFAPGVRFGSDGQLSLPITS